MRGRAPDSDLLLNALAAELLVLLAAELRGRPDRTLPPSIARLTEAMSAQPNLPWTEAAMLDIGRISPAHLRRLFRQHHQMTPRAWLLRERIMLAQELLLQPGMTMVAVSEACGFADIYHFSRAFKQAPGGWRSGEVGKRSGRKLVVRRQTCDPV